MCGKCRRYLWHLPQMSLAYATDVAGKCRGCCGGLWINASSYNFIIFEYYETFSNGITLHRKMGETDNTTNKYLNSNVWTDLDSILWPILSDGYILGAVVSEYNERQKDAFHKGCADIDGMLQIIMSLRQGAPLSIFPYTYHDGTTQWLFCIYRCHL